MPTISTTAKGHTILYAILKNSERFFNFFRPQFKNQNKQIENGTQYQSSSAQNSSPQTTVQTQSTFSQNDLSQNTVQTNFAQHTQYYISNRFLKALLNGLQVSRENFTSQKTNKQVTKNEKLIKDISTKTKEEIGNEFNQNNQPNNISTQNFNFQNQEIKNGNIENKQNNFEAQAQSHNNHSSLFEQIKLQAKYDKLVQKAEDVFPTTYTKNAFLKEVGKNPTEAQLDKMKDYVEIIDLYNTTKNTAVLQNELNGCLKTDKSFMVGFTDFLGKITPPNQTESVLGSSQNTQEFANGVNEFSTPQSEQNILTATAKNEDIALPTKPDFSGKTIIYKPGDPGYIAGENGLKTSVFAQTDPSSIVSASAIEAINQAVDNLEQNSDEVTPEEVTAVANTIDNMMNPPELDMEAPKLDNDGQLSVLSNQPTTAQDNFDPTIQNSLTEAIEEAAETQQEAQEELRRNIESAMSQ